VLGSGVARRLLAGGAAALDATVAVGADEADAADDTGAARVPPTDDDVGASRGVCLVSVVTPRRRPAAPGHL